MSNERSSVPPLPEPVKTRPAVVKTLIAAMLAVLFVGFLLTNSEEVPVEFLWWQESLPLWLILVMSALAGIVIWELASYLRRRRR
jgi:uncharacterized integral membrane protein